MCNLIEHPRQSIMTLEILCQLQQHGEPTIIDIATHKSNNRKTFVCFERELRSRDGRHL